MGENNEHPDVLEGEPYGTIEFEIDVGGAVNKKHLIDCNLATPLIGGLKDDYAGIFDVVGRQQNWYLNDKQLKDDDTLWDCGVRCQDDVTPIKVVCT